MGFLAWRRSYGGARSTKMWCQFDVVLSNTCICINYIYIFVYFWPIYEVLAKMLCSHLTTQPRRGSATRASMFGWEPSACELACLDGNRLLVKWIMFILSEFHFLRSSYAFLTIIMSSSLNLPTLTLLETLDLLVLCMPVGESVGWWFKLAIIKTVKSNRTYGEKKAEHDRRWRTLIFTYFIALHWPNYDDPLL
jgi:hypothetical protein